MDRILSLRQYSRITAKAVIGAVIGPCTTPTGLFLGRYDTTGRLQLVARTTPLTAAHRRDLTDGLKPGGAERPWHARRFTTGWGTRMEQMVSAP
ncbi:hypothetical protein ABZZ79_39500 [Streptomyces sp. NPDC006458]|uniref:hypothetical protein n=1 Tax=Streptomyces sp. NPDC006458 TaxID=3154302 RepID=UPI0033AA47E9